MNTINPYLTFDGNCREAFELYKEAFGGDFDFIGEFGDMPANDEFAIGEGDKKKIMHVSLHISKETTLLGSDRLDGFGPPFVQGNNSSVSINCTEESEAYRLFEVLSKGGNINMPLQKTFWAALYGMFTDRFGVHWMINHEYPEHADFEKQGKA
mgnify:CR=1 FL=1|jgi:PhnB protein